MTFRNQSDGFDRLRAEVSLFSYDRWSKLQYRLLWTVTASLRGSLGCMVKTFMSYQKVLMTCYLIIMINFMIKSGAYWIILPTSDFRFVKHHKKAIFTHNEAYKGVKYWEKKNQNSTPDKPKFQSLTPDNLGCSIHPWIRWQFSFLL